MGQGVGHRQSVGDAGFAINRSGKLGHSNSPSPKVALMPIRVGILVALLLVVGCAGERELEFADWLFDVPEGTPTKEYGPVPLEGRDPQKVQLIEDLVIGDDLNNTAALLYRPSGIVVSEDGYIFVGDSGASDIKMFAPDGTYLKTLGKEGQGPGEFGRMGTMTLAGEHLVINDSRNGRFSIWTLQGDHVADHVPSGRGFISSMQGLADGTIIGYRTERDEDRVGHRVLTRRTIEGEEISSLFRSEPIPAPVPFTINDPVGILQFSLDSFDNPRLGVSVGTHEVIYVSPLREYQILAMSPDGEALWALRVAWDRLPWANESRQELLDLFAADFPEIEEPLNAGDFDWPERGPALHSVSTDGSGRVYVFPATEAFTQVRPAERPVDVYSPSGEFIVAGVVPNTWLYALGDFVYGLRPNEVEEFEVVRYRIVINQ